MPFSIAVDEEIELELLDLCHARPLFELVDDCRDHLRPWLPWVDETRTVDDSIDFVKRTKHKFAQREAVQTGMVYRGDLCGASGLHLAGQRAEIGYWIHPDWEGNGIVTRSCRALVEYGFGELDLRRLTIEVAPDNERSAAIPRRLDFEHEGTLRQVADHPDGPMDMEVYALLADDWTPGQ